MHASKRERPLANIYFQTLEQLAGEVPGTPQYDPQLAGTAAARKRPESYEEEQIGEKRTSY